MALSANRTTFTFNHAGQADEYGASIGDFPTVQENFDSRGKQNLDDINNIKDTMRSIINGDSGADNLRATPLFDGGDSVIQKILEYLYSRINAHQPTLNVKSVLDYGAKCDGVTDDREAIQYAISKMDAGEILLIPGNTVLSKVPDKNYCLLINKSNITILGSNTLISAKNGETDSALFLIGSDGTNFVKTSNIKISGLNFQGNGNGTGNPASGINIEASGTTYSKGDGCENIEIDHCKFLGGFAFSIIGSGVKNLNIHDCYFTDNYFYPALGAGGYGVLEQTCYEVNIHNNKFVATSHDRHGIYISCDNKKTSAKQSEDIKIYNNYIDWTNSYNTTGFEDCIMVRSVKNLEIIGNTLIGGYGGIDLDVAENGNAEKINISHNSILNIKSDLTHDRAGISFLYNDTYSITDSIIESNIITGSTNFVYGIAIYATVFNIINNIINIQGTNSNGIYLYASNKGTISANEVIGNSTARSGIRLSGAIADILILPNKIMDCSTCEETVNTTTNVVHNFNRYALIEADGVGNVSVTEDPFNLIDSVVSNWYGCDITFSNNWIVKPGMLSVISIMGDVYSFTNRGSGTGNVFQLSLKKGVGVDTPLATNQIYFYIHLNS